MNGHSNIIIHRKNYENLRNLNDIEYKVFSQSGEDGIIDFLLSNLKMKNQNLLKLCWWLFRGKYKIFIWEMFSKGLIIDCLNDLENKISKNIKMWTGDLKIVENYINSNNLIKIWENDFINDIDFFSLDIDGVDYWILEKLPDNFSKIAVIEFNANFGDELKLQFLT